LHSGTTGPTFNDHGELVGTGMFEPTREHFSLRATQRTTQKFKIVGQPNDLSGLTIGARECAQRTLDGTDFASLGHGRIELVGVPTRAKLETKKIFRGDFGKKNGFGGHLGCGWGDS
jgi:hypothetical protein